MTGELPCPCAQCNQDTLENAVCRGCDGAKPNSRLPDVTNLMLKASDSSDQAKFYPNIDVISLGYDAFQGQPKP